MIRPSLRQARRAAPLAVLFLSACASVPRLAESPAPRTPDSFAAERSFATTGASAWPAQNWWQVYGDAQLNALIAEGKA